MKRQNRQNRHGFTLIEMMVVIVVLIVLAVLVFSTLTVLGDDPTKEAARSVQSYTEGARDRAIFRKRPVGIRLLLDENGPRNPADNPIAVGALQYIASPSEELEGLLVVRPADPMDLRVADQQQILVNPAPPAPQFTQVWNTLETRRGLIDKNVQMPIEIVVNVGTGATEDYMVHWNEERGAWMLTRPFAGPQGVALEYKLTLLPAVMPNQSIRELPRGTVINLRDSRIPSFWFNQGKYTSYLDIMFSPRGTGIGSASAQIVHLHVCSSEDLERVSLGNGQVLGNPANQMIDRLVSINPITGNISVADVPPFVDADNNDLPDSPNYDPYRLAEQGVTAQ